MNDIIQKAIESALPDHAVKEALSHLPEKHGKLILVALGKAAWQMSFAAEEILKDEIADGICITKYGHVKSSIPRVTCIEAGHPIPDENSVLGAKKAEELVKGLNADDIVLLLISGGGSALFEDPLVSLEELQDITKKMLACGADITEINTIRKRLSRVKGGRFAELCRPAQVFSIILSDIIGDPLDMIASGPACPDRSTSEEALSILAKYKLELPEPVFQLLKKETPKELDNVQTHITGSVRQLCRSAMNEAEHLGYEPHFLTASLCCCARDAGSFLAAIAKDHADTEKNIAYICGGETIVHLTGKGLGGRNQEIALSCADGISGLNSCAVASVGSDGTDGPTDAAGGYADGRTAEALAQMGISIPSVLDSNDSYHALQKTDGLIITGPTGTNVNDVAVLLIRKKDAA